MRRIVLTMALFLALGLPRLSAQQHPQQRHFLLNRDVVALAKAGFSEQVIIETIRVTPSRFDVRTDALAALSGQGISQRVVEAMLVAKTCGSQSDLASPRCDPPPDKRLHANGDRR
ncbi:MAG: hypothetical protein LAP38_12645 [Acidobacteriia bacterium]|nr:hypothetical protein [Terriglobia bacterium]